jgi:glycosyltransferase involved in cell wall biosynthesis
VSLFHIDAGREWGGTERQALALAREIRTRGFASRFVVQPETPLHKHASAEGLPVLPLNMPGGKNLWSALRLSAAMRRERCVLVHFHDPAGLAVGATAASMAKVPLRVLSRQTEPPRRSGGALAKGIDVVISGSEGLKDVLVRGGLPEKAIEVIPSGIDFSPYDGVPDRDYLRQEFSFAADDFLVGVVAGLEDPRSYQEVVGAAKIIADHAPKSRVIILGEGALRLEPDKKGHDLPADNVFYYLGFRDHLPRVLASLDVFVTTSPLVGFGGGLLDAMACRIPVVAAGGGGMPEVLVHRETGLVVPHRDPRSLAEAVLKLYLDRNLAARLAQRGQETVREKYSTEAMARKTIAVYERLASRKGVKLG